MHKLRKRKICNVVCIKHVIAQYMQAICNYICKFVSFEEPCIVRWYTRIWRQSFISLFLNMQFSVIQARLILTKKATAGSIIEFIFRRKRVIFKNGSILHRENAQLSNIVHRAVTEQLSCIYQLRLVPKHGIIWRTNKRYKFGVT